jgi:hypothetical protein
LRVLYFRSRIDGRFDRECLASHPKSSTFPEMKLSIILDNLTEE